MEIKEEIIKIRKENPCLTLREIASKSPKKISHERVRQILNSAGMPTKHTLRLNHICPNCGITFHITPSIPQVFCSLKCLKEYTRGTFTCDVCGRQFVRPISSVAKNLKYKTENHKLFCSRKCHGHWLGVTHGSIFYNK